MRVVSVSVEVAERKAIVDNMHIIKRFTIFTGLFSEWILALRRIVRLSLNQTFLPSLNKKKRRIKKKSVDGYFFLLHRQHRKLTELCYTWQYGMRESSISTCTIAGIAFCTLIITIHRTRANHFRHRRRCNNNKGKVFNFIQLLCSAEFSVCIILHSACENDARCGVFLGQPLWIRNMKGDEQQHVDICKFIGVSRKFIRWQCFALNFTFFLVWFLKPNFKWREKIFEKNGKSP